MDADTTRFDDDIVRLALTCGTRVRLDRHCVLVPRTAATDMDIADLVARIGRGGSTSTFEARGPDRTRRYPLDPEGIERCRLDLAGLASSVAHHGSPWRMRFGSPA